jgi:hypothetical protein
LSAPGYAFSDDGRNWADRIASPARAGYQWTEQGEKFKALHGHRRHTIAFNEVLLYAARDETLAPADFRALLGAMLACWGQLSDTAVDNLPPVTPADPPRRPLTQAEFAKGIGLAENTLSGCKANLRERGYLPNGDEWM